MSVLAPITKKMEAIAPGTFPVDVFPEQIRCYLNELHDYQGFPIDYTAGGVLFAASVAIGNTMQITPKNAWVEPSTLWCVIVGRSGATKTHPLNYATLPISESDHRLAVKFNAEMQRYEEKVEEYRSAKSSGDEVEKPVKPVYRKRLARDYTIESLLHQHTLEVKGVSVLSDELPTWLQNFTRYNSSKGELSLWNSIWSCQRVTVDRRDSSAQIPVPHMAVAGTIQPGIISSLTKDGGVHNGFLDRFLFFYPTDASIPHWSEDEVNKIVLDQYAEIICRLNDLEVDKDEAGYPLPNRLSLDKDAKALYRDFYNENVDECNKSSSDITRSMLAKMRSYCLRLALVLNSLNWAAGTDGYNTVRIGAGAMEGAIKLCKYFQFNAQKVHDLLSQTDPYSFITDIQLKWLKALSSRFTTKEAKEAGEILDVKPRTIEDWLKSDKLPIEKIRHANYRKLPHR